MISTYIDPLGTTTCTSISATLEDTIDTIDSQTATITTATSTISTLLSNQSYASHEMSSKFLDSLTDEQLSALILKIEEKENGVDLTYLDHTMEIKVK